ncbi:MAG: hypothetical protein LAN63_05235 [Acidobacteriia bacterium]|nr:hypothetical protein [Terriglobia bacterium]
MKRTFAGTALLALVATGAFAAANSGTWTGWVSDAKCGAKVDAACARKCTDAGQARVFVNDANQSVLRVANQDALKGHEGHHVKVAGSVEDGTLTVSSVSMLPDQTMK